MSNAMGGILCWGGDGYPKEGGCTWDTRHRRDTDLREASGEPVGEALGFEQREDGSGSFVTDQMREVPVSGEQSKNV